jgi:hypothetical protein
MADIQINFGNRPRRRRRRRAMGAAGLIAVLVAAALAWFRPKPAAGPALPSAATAVDRLRAFAPALEQIPATVVDKGPLRNVPYLSYRAGDVEVNAYGDPDRPACLEIGIFGDAARRPAARDALAALVGADLGGLNMSKDKRSLGGLTYEITPETAPDAYGAWWVSVYDPKALDAARASDAEMKDVAVPRPAGDLLGRPGATRWLKSYKRLGKVYSPR